MRWQAVVGLVVWGCALASGAARAGAPGDAGWPLVVAAPVAAPVIDGEVRPAEWPGACLTGLSHLGGRSGPAQQPVFWVAYDDANLYVAGRLPLPAGAHPRAQGVDRDGALWEDDAVEVFVDPTHSHRDYYQFIVNARGTLFDGRGQNSGWNCRARVAGRTGGGEWSCELAIPWADLGGKPAVGETIGLNVCWDRLTPEGEAASWAPMQSRFHEPEHFGHLVLGAGPAAQVTDLGPLTQGAWAVTAAGPAEGAVRVSVTEQPGGKEIFSRQERLTGGQATIGGRLPEALAAPGKGRFALAYEVSSGSTTLSRGTAAFIVQPPLKCRLYPIEGLLEVDCRPAGTRPARFAVSLAGKGGERLTTAALPAGAVEVTARLKLAGLPAGDYTLSVAAQDAAGQVLEQQQMPLELPPRPAWLGSKEGLAAGLPAGWPAVQVKGSTVRVWGREYRFGRGLFATAVTARGTSLLANAPIEAQVAWRGGKAALAGPPARVVSRTPEKVVLQAHAAAGPFRAEGTVAVEFDGMIRTDFTITSAARSPLEGLTLTIPLRAEHAKLLYHYPGQWGSSYNASALPAAGWQHAFKPYVWLGDEARGLCWFTESDQEWLPADNPRAIEVVRQGGRVLLRLNVIGAPRSMDRPLKLTFGFQATPVKPVRQDVWDYRICHEGSYDLPDRPYQPPANVTYPAPGHIRLDRGTVEMWVTPRFDPQVVVPAGVAPGNYNQELLSLPLPGNSLLGFYWNIDDRGMRFFIKDGDQYPVLIGGPAGWRQGERHHIALTWGDRICIYLDGKLTKTADWRGTLERDLATCLIRLGVGVGRFEVDELRISDLARTEFDLTRAPAADEHTLLLDHFDGTTRPAGGTAAGGASLAAARFGRAVRLFSPGKPMTAVDHLAKLGVRTVVMHEHWTDIQNYTSTTHGAELRRLVAACHQRGMRLLLYFGYEISDVAPEFPAFADECLVYPRTGGYTRQPPQTAYTVCYRGAWQDFMAAGIARMMDEYGIDGVYLDGTANPPACANRHHGCGYLRADGALRPTYPFFATRQMMRRLYTIVKSRQPDGLVNVHQSTCMTIPSLAFATSYWDGEQFGGIEQADVMKLLPLDTFRAEFMGHQWGVPAEFLCYGRPYTYDQALSFTLLHDVLVRGGLGNGSLETEAKLWRAMDWIGRKDAQWLPYWANWQVLKAAPAGVKVSLYNRPGRGALAIVSNLGKEAVGAEVVLDGKKLGLPAGCRAVDVVTGEAVGWDGKVLRARLAPLGFVAVRLGR